MGLLAQIRTANYLYLDTNLYIYFFENLPTWGEQVISIIRQSLDNHQSLLASQLLLTELLTKPFERDDHQLIDTYTKLDQKLPNLIFYDIDKIIAVKAAAIRAKYHLHTPDSIHLATAIAHKADFFITSDHRLKPISEIPILVI